VLVEQRKELTALDRQVEEESLVAEIEAEEQLEE
jgi:hypothetical protein